MLKDNKQLNSSRNKVLRLPFINCFLTTVLRKNMFTVTKIPLLIVSYW